ncbi:SLP adapter and CSK-interacting membrane protein-like [Triplophysa rosa]|uniref:SLP adapter and CSK-interacting membrane protein n=1 Tax=Triplophysa rosa TaxID=992332 RepID=A0A9W7X4E5_TRIRA|nr:SLP adapter and CSK-interacting membrane protein-like [Triplophysa rosa]KAI7813545.1 hypothetical protein IRJ41_018624 [Triplophysa rosa]
MESLRSYFWAILLLAIIALSLVIIMIFIIINVCISKKVTSYHTQTKSNNYSDIKLKNQDNPVFHKNVENEKPPLPPRDQFQSMDSVDQGYEHVEPLPDYVVVEESAPAEPQQPFTPQYATVETKSQDGVSVEEDYDDVEMPANYDSEDYDEVG